MHEYEIMYNIMYYGQYALDFGHDIYAYCKLYKLYLYIKISHIGTLLGLRADRALAGHEQKRIFTIMYIKSLHFYSRGCSTIPCSTHIIL